MFDSYVVSQEHGVIHYLWAARNMKFLINIDELDNIYLYKKFLEQHLNHFPMHDRDSNSLYHFTRVEAKKFHIRKLR